MPEMVFKRSGSGEPLVAIHGLGGRLEMWDPVIPALEAKREVVALDLPGFGRSPPLPDGGAPGPEALTDAVEAFISAQGLDRPHVAGNSLGGWIALNLARRGLVRSATALSPAGFANRRERGFARASLRLTRRSLRALRPMVARVATNPTIRTAAALQYFAKPWRIPTDHAVALFEGLADSPAFDETLDAMLAEERFAGGDGIAVPVTIAWGTQDRLLFPRQSRRAARWVPGARMLALRGCGHCPFWDDPSSVADAILETT